MNVHRRLGGLFAVMILLITAIVIRCTSDRNIAGTSVIGNPESVSAVVVDMNGIPQKNIPVALVPADYNAVKQNDTMVITQGKTDSSGRVVLRLGNDTVYNLTSTSDIYRYELLKRVVISDSVKNLKNKTVELGVVQLKDPGTILVTIDSSSYSFGNYIAIPGTFITMQIDTPGIYSLKSPAGIVDIRYCNILYDTTNENTISSVQVNSDSIVKVTTSKTDSVLTADTTTINDTILIGDTLIMKDTVIAFDTVHFVDTMHTNSPILSMDSIVTTDTINRNSQVLHGTGTINRVDSVVTADTTVNNDTTVVIRTIKRITSRDVIDTTKKFDTLWLLNSTRSIVTLGTVNNTVYIDSIQTKATVVKRTIQRATRRIVSISNVIVTYRPAYRTNPSDTSVKKDTLISSDIKDVVDSIIIPDTSIQIDTTVKTMVIPADSQVSRDTSLVIDTLKNSRASCSIDTMTYKDSIIYRDTLKLPNVSDSGGIHDSVSIGNSYLNKSDLENGIDSFKAEELTLLVLNAENAITVTNGKFRCGNM